MRRSPSSPTRSSGRNATHGPGCIAVSHGSHHTWGNIGYYLSALFRFSNAIGMTRVHHNPDSWEGWYWGAVHHWGHTLRVGQSETYGTVEDCLQNCDMIVSWAADPETTSGSYGAQEGTVRRQWLKNPKLGIKVVHVDPYYNATAQFLPGKWFAPKPTTSPAMAMAIAYVWIKEGLYDKEYVKTHTVGFDKWAAYLTGEEDGIPKTPEWQEKETGVPAKDVRALAREWGKQARLSRARRLGQRPRRRLPQPDRHPVGARDGVPVGDAGARQARLQHGQSAMGHAGRLQFLFPRLFRRRHVGRPREHRDAGRALPAHAATADHELQRPADSAHLAAGGDRRRQGGGLSLGRQVDRAPVRQVLLSGAGPFAGEDALQVRRLDPRHHEQHQPPCADVPVGESGVRGQPVDLVRGRGEVRRRHPAGLHQLRAHRHLGMGGARRLRPSRPAAAQSPRHHLPGAGDRAARRVEVRLLDLQRDLQAARPVELFLRRHQRDRLGQAHLSRLRPAEGDLVQEAAQARLLRRAGREGKAARAGVLPLVLGGPQEGRAGGAAAAVRLHRGISAAACRPSPASSNSSATASSASRTRSGRRSSNTSRRGRARTRRSSSAIRCSC